MQVVYAGLKVLPATRTWKRTHLASRESGLTRYQACISPDVLKDYDEPDKAAEGEQLRRDTRLYCSMNV